MHIYQEEVCQESTGYCRIQACDRHHYDRHLLRSGVLVIDVMVDSFAIIPWGDFMSDFQHMQEWIPSATCPDIQANYKTE
jgi:hypothetical protein